MIENSVEYQDGYYPEEVDSLITKAADGHPVPQEELREKDIYAIVNRTDRALYITLGYYLPEEASRLEEDSVFTQEFRIRITDSDDKSRVQVMYHSTPINPFEKIGPGVKFVNIETHTYQTFYTRLKSDGLFDWEEVERRVLAD